MYIRTPGDVRELDARGTERSSGTTAEQMQNGSGRWEPQVVKEERFLRLHAEEVIGRVKTPDAKSAARNAARFYEVSPPGPGASLKEMSAYRERAVKAGLPITAQDIENYQIELQDATQGATLMSCQETFVTGAADFFQPTPGTQILAQAVLRHNPKLVEHMKLTNMQVRDNQENVNPNLTKDLDPEQRLYEDPERFRADMNALGKMGPLPKKPTADQIGQYREHLRKVGVRLTLDDVKTYQKVLAEQGMRGLHRPGATNGMPLSSAMLADLHRKPAARELVGADAERFAHALQKRPQMRPPLPLTNDREAARNGRAERNDRVENPSQHYPADARREEAQPARIEQSVAQASPEADLPPLGNDALQQRVRRAAFEMTRGGKTVALHDGYQQTGRIVAFDSGRGEVIQRVNKDETVTYKLDDFDRAMNRDILEDAVRLGHDVRVNVRDGEMAVKDLSLERGTKFVAPAMPQGETKERPSSGVYGVPIPAPEALQDHGPTMVRDGKQQTIPSGYQQTGRLFMVSNGQVFQRIDKDTSVRYPEADVRAALGGGERLQQTVMQGHDVRIRVQAGRMTAANVGLEQAQQRNVPAMHERG